MSQRRNQIISLFVNKDRQARFWFALFLLSVILFGIERWRIVTELSRERQFVVMDSNTYYLPKSVDFQSAEQVHLAQLTLAMESVFNRNPGGEDNPDRLVRLFDREAHRKAKSLISEEAAEFDAKEIHQKVEIGSAEILETREETVLASASGQLIRTGNFDGTTFTEVLAVTARFRFEHNKDILTNGGFPTVVTHFEIETREKTSS